VWSSEYHQNGAWHGPHQCSLKFDRETGKIAGEGTDDVGRFTIDGTSNSEMLRMDFTKFYEVGTGNVKENSGHSVTVQLTWNPSTAQFEGTRYVEATNCHGGDDFRLKFKDYEVSSN
jgi:hypothetical protein